MTVEIIRHGLTALQEEHRYQGRTDAGLSETGRFQLKKAETHPELLFVSPLLRARETASILYPELEQKVVSGLEEMNFGFFEAKSAAEMENDLQYRKWVESGCEGLCPGGESRKVFCERTVSAFSRIMEYAALQKIQTVCVVAHGGTQMAVMERFCTETRNYFDWRLDSGKGYLCSCENWLYCPELKLVSVTNYHRS